MLFSLIMLTAMAPRAMALDPARALSQYQSQSWGPEQGLPCNDVLAVTQSSDGYLWLGTEEGLVRFDGVRARVHDRQTDPALGGNNVSSVLEDPRQPGQIVLGSAGGVALLDKGRVRALPAAGVLGGHPGQILFRDPADGALWVRTSRGLFRVGPQEEGPFEEASGWPVDKIQAVCRDGTGRLWAGTARGLYRQHDGTADGGFRLDLFPGWSGKAVDYLIPARSGGIWVGSRDAGTGRLDADGAFRPRATLAGRLVTAMLEDRAGMLWVGTRGSGLLRLPAQEDDTRPGMGAESLAADRGLISNQVNGLCEDWEGSLWIATAKGLQVLRDVRFVTYGIPEGVAGEFVRTVFGDAGGRLWIGHENGLSVLRPPADEVNNFSLPPSPRRPGDATVSCVGPGEEADTLWVGTNAGLARWRMGKLALVPLREDLDGSAVRALCRDAAGNQWVGTDTGLYQVRGDQVAAHITAAGGLANNVVRALHADRRGNLWIATDNGLNRLGPDHRIATFLGAEANRAAVGVLSFFENPDGSDELFVGTELGLHRLRAAPDGGEPRITAYTVREGLFDDMLWSLLGDDRGNLWMSSNRGISRVAKADLERFDRGEITRIPHVAYGMADGMRSREANGGRQPAAWRDQAGRLWFATVRGAACMDPARMASNGLPPPVQVEELLADGRLVNVGGAQPPAMPAGTQKFEVRFTALSMRAPERNRFRYQLGGFDPDWTDAGTARTAHYTNLSPGHYRFRVQAANADGVWNEAGASLSFVLHPFWYQTGWFRALTAGLALASVWLAQRRVRRRWQRRLAHAEAELRERRQNQDILRQAKEAAERERRVAEQARAEAEHARVEAERANAAKSEFLSRMSHELRTPLNAILGFGQLLEMEASGAQQESVGHILGGGRHLLGLVDEILDLSRVERGQTGVFPKALALAPLVAEVTGLIGPLAREQGVEVWVAPEIAAVHILADPHRLKQILLNLLANAVKYNRPTGGEVFVEAQEIPPMGAAPARLRVFVRDTGAGIDAVGLAKLFTPFERLGAAYGPIEGTGLGLTVSKQLVEAMGGTIGVKSALGVGSTFWVELPVAAVPLGFALPLTGDGATLPVDALPD